MFENYKCTIIDSTRNIGLNVNYHYKMRGILSWYFIITIISIVQLAWKREK